jgi:hypothetical protein
MSNRHNEPKNNQTNRSIRPIAAPEFSSFTNTPGLAARYEVSPRCIQNWVARKFLPVLKIGRSVRFNIAACDRALAKFERKAAGE